MHIQCDFIKDVYYSSTTPDPITCDLFSCVEKRSTNRRVVIILNIVRILYCVKRIHCWNPTIKSRASI